MTPEPVGQVGLIEVAARQGKNERDHILFRRIDAEPVQAEKQIHGLERDPLVAVYKRVIAREPESIGGSQRREV